MTVQSAAVDTVHFPCTPWEMRGSSLNAIPGTWTLAPDEALFSAGVKGILCCPNRECREAVLIQYDMGTVENGVLKLERLQCRKCRHLCHARLLQWDTRKLYCIAYEILHADGTATLRKEYTHAEGRPEALATFVHGTGYQLDHVECKTWRLVDAGLAIGYFGQESDKNQIQLSVD